MTLDELLSRTRPNGECLEWTKGLTSSRPGLGYAAVKIGGKMRGAHRVVYELTHGVRLTRSQFVCHSCDNRKCINPNHLWLGSHTDNVRDMHAKRRAIGNKRLTEDQVREIRRRFRSRRGSDYGNRAELAREFDISRASITDIVSGRTWQDVA